MLISEPKKLFNCNVELLPFECKKCNSLTQEKIVRLSHICGVKSSSKRSSKICKHCGFKGYSVFFKLQHRLQCNYGKCKVIEIRRFHCHNNCGFNTIQKSSLKTHIKACPKRNKQFTCDQCFFSTYTAAILKGHILNRHTSDELIKWFYCEECPYRSKHISSLKIHKTLKHFIGIPKYACDQCLYVTHMENRFKNHKTKHLSYELLIEKEYKCDKCFFQTHDKDNLRYHIEIRHTPDELINWFSCNECFYKGKSKKNLIRHIRTQHSLKEKIFMCDICFFSTSSTINLREHKRRKHTPENLIKWIICQMCPYRAKEPSKLKMHMIRMHSDLEKKYKCPDCAFGTHTNANLKYHFASKHPSYGVIRKVFKCDECLFQTHTSKLLMSHKISRHTPTELINWKHCSKCDYKAKFRSCLNRHIKARHLN